MRIAIGQLLQETNSFNRNPTSREDYEAWGVATGPDVLERYGQTGELSGFIEGCRQGLPEADLTGLFRLFAWSSGELSGATVAWMRTLIQESLAKAGPLDGVLVSLHGALAAEVDFDVTGSVLRLIREELGPSKPLIATLDLHANVTPLMMRHADVLCGYLTAPHLDHQATGMRAARALERMIHRGEKPVKWMRKLPFFTPAESHNTFTGIPAELYAQVLEWEQDPQVLSAGLYMVQPWLDVPGLGWTITLHTTQPDPRWQTQIDQLADRCWNVRHRMSDIPRLGPQEVIQRACASPALPVVIGDGADSTNSGAPGDSTVLLRELLKCPKIPQGALIFLVDPEGVAAAYQAGSGNDFDRFVGASYAPEYSNPIRLQGRVEKLTHVRFQLNGHGGANIPIDMGRAAIVRAGDVRVLLVEKTGPGSTPLLYESVGLDPRKAGIVIAKSPAGFRADYESFAGQMLLAECPGCATANWSRLKFQQVHQPLWPLQQIEQPSEATWCAEYSCSPMTSPAAAKS